MYTPLSLRMIQIKLLLLITGMLLMLPACILLPTTPPALTPTASTQKPTPGATPLLTLSPTPSQVSQVTVSPQQSVESAARWVLAAYLAVEPGSLILESRTEAEWPDGCLGLAGKDEMCITVIVQGWRFVFQHTGVQYEVRTNMDGSSVRIAPQPPPLLAQCQPSPGFLVFQMPAYCFQYPADFEVGQAAGQETRPISLQGPPRDDAASQYRAALWIEESQPVENQALPELVSASLSGTQVLRSRPVGLDGELAELVEIDNGSDAARLVLVLHEGVFYTLRFSPAQPAATQATQDMDRLFTSVWQSWRFTASPAPETFDCRGDFESSEFPALQPGEPARQALDSGQLQHILQDMGVSAICLPYELGAVFLSPPARSESEPGPVQRIVFEHPGIELVSVPYQATQPGYPVWANQADRDLLQAGQMDNAIESAGTPGFYRLTLVPTQGVEAVYGAYVFPQPEKYVAVVVFLGYLTADASQPFDSRAARFLSGDFPAYRVLAARLAETMTFGMEFWPAP